jgi:hypothetical protein
MSDLVCHKCGKKIPPDMAYVAVRGDIILRTPGKKPMVFTCVEQAFNYAQHLIVHDACWIEMLRIYGVQLYDMNKVAESYKKEAEKHGMG